MNIRIENIGVLVGLFALAVPVILHFLQRRHHEIVDWGAMQFLPDSISTQRRRWLDELLLLLLRMAMIALIVLALATPISTSAWLAPFGDRSSRDVVIVLDDSYSMDVRIPGQPTPWAQSLAWVHARVAEAPGSVRFTFLTAGTPLRPVDVEDLAALTPRSNPNVSQALAQAWNHLQKSNAVSKEIIVLTDGQYHGWADAETLAALDNLGAHWHADVQRAHDEGAAIPSMRVVKIGTELPKDLPNYAVAPLTTARSVVKLGHKSSFQSALRLQGFGKYAPPRSVKVLVDGKVVESLALPSESELKDGQIPLTFHHRFENEGRHRVSLVVDADRTHDVLAGDNEQKVAVEVVKEVPVLIIDGDTALSASSSSFFLQRALGSQRAIPVAEMKEPAIFTERGEPKPAVIVLADVPRLEPGQIEAINRFVGAGGGLLIFVGERVAGAKSLYNEQLYRNGQGWLPAAPGEVASSKDGMQPDPRTFQHPALELFRVAPEGVMSQVRFPKWWKMTVGPKDRALPVATLVNGDPLLLERPYQQGRVILCTVPPDRRWGSTLPNAVEFPILIHELVYYLAGNRAAAGDAKPMDLRESNLARCSDDDWRKVRDRFPIAWHEKPDQDSIAADEPRREEIWWLLLIAVLALLCTEVWMTRRLALARGR